MTTIKITDAFTLNELKPIKEKVDNVDKTKDITLQLENITNIDISAIQLIVSLKKEQEMHNRKLHISIDCNDQTKQLLTNTGFSNLFKLKQ